MTVQCCKCKRIRRESGWAEPEGEVRAREGFTHSYCPACAEEFHLELFSAQASRATLAHAHRVVETLNLID